MCFFVCFCMHECMLPMKYFLQLSTLFFETGYLTEPSVCQVLNGTVRPHSLLAYISSSSSKVKVCACHDTQFYVNAMNTGTNSYPCKGSCLHGPKIYLRLTYRRIFKSQKLHNYIEILSHLQGHRHQRESFSRMIFSYEIWIQSLYRGWGNVQSIKPLLLSKTQLWPSRTP